MQSLRCLLLTLMLTTGFCLPSCDVENDSCDGVVFLNFFDVTGLDLSLYTNFEEGQQAVPGDTIAFDALDRIFIDYLVDYLASRHSTQDWSVQLLPKALACSYIAGNRGSKEEALIDFSITTLNDFDADHLAGANINDLFELQGFYLRPVEPAIPLAQYLSEQTGNLEQEDMLLKLTKAPSLNPEFRIRVRMELSTGEVYEEESLPIFLLP